ncbi:hypothetical protein J5N97_022815 [Dioscorea zingiberensis]|uniref:Uncharacterized protein n=1 Tax=Dioscorea zingiberensis TaxID=325984 RepID=A0A9D5CBX5_9LILI|nr:hypothetical protein J5N97_022815 [Dioscorea zingiberensis]
MGRSPCCEKAHTNKGAWTKEEDERLIAHIKAHGEGCWRSLPKAAGLLRCGKSCRLRWINYLRPDLKRGNFTEEEDELIIKLHSLLGNKWSLIAGRLPGRTDNEIKNYWNTHIRRKLLSRGVDPATHRPLHQPLSDITISFVKKEERSSTEDKDDVHVMHNYQKQQQQEKLLRCPDLNLELCISPPFQEMNSSTVQPVKREGESVITYCFTCSLGLHKSQGCNCKCVIPSTAFLGLEKQHFRGK